MTPTPTGALSWTFAFYDNPSLSGAPVITGAVDFIDYDWGEGAPAQGLPADGFSARWSSTRVFDGRFYEIRLEANGGVRLWFDGRSWVDEWSEGPHTVSINRRIPLGAHEVIVEFFDTEGPAAISLTIGRPGERGVRRTFGGMMIGA